MKICMKCNKEKELEEFYKHPKMADGHLNKCIECAKKDVNKRYDTLKDSPEFILAERNRTRERYYRLKYKDKYVQSGEQKRRTIEKYFDNYPERKKVANIVSNKIRDGHLEKQPCEICKSTINVQAHHEDYSKPLDITWLCVKCHNQRHVFLREQLLRSRH